MLIIGKPGTGKSHLITELITNENFYRNKFDKVLILSPSDIPGMLLNENN